jgi:hypothetical protein
MFNQVSININNNIKTQYIENVGNSINKKLTNNKNLYHADLISHIFSFIFENSIEVKLLNDIYNKLLNVRRTLVFNIKKYKRGKNKIVLSIYINLNKYNDMHFITQDKMFTISINKFKIQEDEELITRFYNYMIDILNGIGMNDYRHLSDYKYKHQTRYDVLIS